MANKVIGNAYGKFFVKGNGFSAYDVKAATKFACASQAEEAAQCARDMGISGVYVKTLQEKSFAVNYIRPEDLNSDGSIKVNGKNPSRRRFATREEANVHGRRFDERKKAYPSQELAGHIGFYVVETSDPVNAKISSSGLTNSL